MNRVTRRSEIEGKATRVGASERGVANEWSRGDASDIDGKTERSIWAGAHESISIKNEEAAAPLIFDVRGLMFDVRSVSRTD
jgi:hypothetical protein